MKSFKYDIALSFAGEDRDYVRRIANSLRANDVRVFFDEYEIANLLGKELYEHLEDIYANHSKHVAVFVSKPYFEKEWTNHERTSILNAAFERKNDYILPVRLDQTKLPGLHKSIGYISAMEFAPNKICNFLLQKLEILPSTIISADLLLYRITSEKYQDNISGLGATLFSGRWHKKGTPILYASSSISLAMLELFSFTGMTKNLENMVNIQYSIPSSINIETNYGKEFPKAWTKGENLEFTQKFGTQWAEKSDSCILSVPSVVVPNERNYLLNPNHLDFQLLRKREAQRISLDRSLN